MYAHKKVILWSAIYAPASRVSWLAYYLWFSQAMPWYMYIYMCCKYGVAQLVDYMYICEKSCGFESCLRQLWKWLSWVSRIVIVFSCIALGLSLNILYTVECRVNHPHFPSFMYSNRPEVYHYSSHLHWSDCTQRRDWQIVCHTHPVAVQV